MTRVTYATACYRDPETRSTQRKRLSSRGTGHDLIYNFPIPYQVV